MKSMDFKEYLWAKGISDNVISYVENCFETKEKLSESVNTTIISYFKEYLCVGGMPEVVNVFLNTHDMNKFRIHKDIF